MFKKKSTKFDNIIFLLMAVFEVRHVFVLKRHTQSVCAPKITRYVHNPASAPSVSHAQEAGLYT